jgi:hypothetical protein
MAKKVFQVPSFTATATADTTNFAHGTYLAITSGGATNRVVVSEIYMGGQSAASNVNIMMFARNSTIGATPSALVAPNSDGPLDAGTSAPSAPAVGFVSSVTAAQRSAVVSSARLALTYNSFGGIVRWVAAPGYEWVIYGTSTNASESSLSGYTGGGSGVMGAHIVYEQV